jgi:phenylpropionate dioxygenase-like ring-hydroxylating dioxygenase large terminal subunit
MVADGPAMWLCADRHARKDAAAPRAARPGPPSFAEAPSRHQQVRAAGLHPDYWYPVEYDDRVRGGQVVEVRFWGQSIALYRGADGRMRALENRCAHRQLPLSLGAVTGCELTCAYHGWRYGEDGRLTAIPHELFGHAQPTVGVATYPVRVRHGLVWLFPGDPALAARRAIPEIPALDGPDPWAYVPLDLTWRAHHSMVMANLCDLSHAHPHRRFPSFLPARLLSCAADADRVAMRYEARVGPFAHQAWAEPRLLEIVYEYPYHRARFQWSNIDGDIAYWTFLLPAGPHTTRVFFVFCYDRLAPRMVPLRLGHGVLRTLLRLIGPSLRRLLGQDRFALEAEQAGWDRHFEQPIPDLNPVVPLVERLTIDKWKEHLGAAATSAPPQPAARR